MDGLRTASAVAAVPKAGLTVSTTPCTAECLGWPIYLRLRLSVGSFFLCLLRQGIFIQGKTLLHLLFSGTSVACKCLLGVRVVGQCLQVMLADALEVKLESPRWPLSSCKFSPENTAGIQLSSIMETWPSQHRCPYLNMVYMTVIPALSSTVLLGTLSLKEMTKMCLRQCRWKENGVLFLLWAQSPLLTAVK